VSRDEEGMFSDICIATAKAQILAHAAGCSYLAEIENMADIIEGMNLSMGQRHCQSSWQYEEEKQGAT
jgi:hypothetical protein